MLRVSLPGLSNQQMKMMPMAVTSFRTCSRYDFSNGKRNYMTAAVKTGNVAVKKMRLSISPLASSALAESRNSSRANLYKEMIEAARDKFTREISFQSKDISLAKALLYIAAEDEAFKSLNREIDASSLLSERRNNLPTPSTDVPVGWEVLEDMPMAGKKLNEWLDELDVISKEVEAELVEREIGCDLVEVMEAVNKVLFESRGFKRSTVIVDSKCSYLHSVLSSGQATAILLSVIYIEVCQRLHINVVGSRVGEDFLIWPSTGNPEELFKADTSGESLFGVVNGKCVEDPRSKASDINSNSLLGLDIATNRDIIGIALANLIRLYWKRASRTNLGLMLTSPLRSVYRSDSSNMPLLRPQELRLAIMASERLLILEPHNWASRRDHGMMLYYNREYEAAVQELSICMAFAPEEESQVLEPFVEKLHLMRLETSWKFPKGRLTVT